MSIDLNKLTPAPWEVSGSGRSDHAICGDATDTGNRPLFERWDGKSDDTDAQFCALARNAFDVMMRRGWSAIQQPDDSWGVFLRDCDNGYLIVSSGVRLWSDPFTALIEADKWYRENVKEQT